MVICSCISSYIPYITYMVICSCICSSVGSPVSDPRCDCRGDDTQLAAVATKQKHKQNLTATRNHKQHNNNNRSNNKHSSSSTHIKITIRKAYYPVLRIILISTGSAIALSAITTKELMFQTLS
jgi:hypothetical protein